MSPAFGVYDTAASATLLGPRYTDSSRDSWEIALDEQAGEFSVTLHTFAATNPPLPEN